MSDFEFGEVAADDELHVHPSINEAENPIADVTREIFETFEECPTVHRIGETLLPSYPNIAEALDNLLEITSPGYGRNQNMKRLHAPFQIGSLIVAVFKILIVEGVLDLRSDPKRKNKSNKELRIEVGLLIIAFLKKIPALIRQLEEDLAAAFRNDPAAKSLELVLLSYPGILAVRIHRIAHTLHDLGFVLIPRMLAEIAHAKTAVDIHPGATIGHSFFIDHGSGVVIGETAELGDNVVLYGGVTIGARKFHRDGRGYIIHDEVKRHPTIGNRVTIYANATILGGDTYIGDDVIIGASCWIEESVAARKLVTIEKPNQRLIDVAPKPRPSVNLPEAKPMTEDDRYQMFLDSIDRCDDN